MHFTEDQIAKALETFHDLKSATKVVRKLGYPSTKQLYKWIKKEGQPHQERKQHRIINTPEHPPHAPFNVKLEAIRRCYEMGEPMISVAKDIGYTYASIYYWYQDYKKYGLMGLQNKPRPTKRKLEKEKNFSSEDAKALNEKIRSLQLEVDILKETLNIIKKDPGVDLSAFRNREKTQLVNALRNRYKLRDLLLALGMSRSVYYYNVKHLNDRSNKDLQLLKELVPIFKESNKTYGYRRIHSELLKTGRTISEKIVRRAMKLGNLVVYKPKKLKYSSYKGEITPAVPNILNRNFHADAPNQKWLTDITEFPLHDGKVYLSPIIDCFDGAPVCWTIGESPDATLVDEMLDKAVATLHEGEAPIIHTDRGSHYRWPGWIERMKKYGLTRSMSRKGYTPDNAACEGFFGILKNEFFYSRNWGKVDKEEFKVELEKYLEWFCTKRIKIRLNGMSPLDYRKLYLDKQPV